MSKLNIRKVIAAGGGDPISFLTNLKTILLPGNAMAVDKIISDLKTGVMTPVDAVNQASNLLNTDQQQRDKMPAGTDVMDLKDTSALSNMAPADKFKAPVDDESNIEPRLTDEEKLGGSADPDYLGDLGLEGEKFGGVSPFLKQLFKLAEDDPFAAMDPDGIKKEVEKKRQHATITTDVANKMEDVGKAMEEVKTKFTGSM